MTAKSIITDKIAILPDDKGGWLFESHDEETSNSLKELRKALEKRGLNVEERFYGDGFYIF